MTDLSNIWKFDLRQGNSDHPRDGACLLDAVSWFAYGHLGDRPECACPVITEFAIGVNDMLPGKERQKLKPFIFRLMGSRDPDSEQARAEYLGVSKDTVYGWIAKKDMPAHKVGRLWKFKTDEVDDWVRHGKALDDQKEGEAAEADSQKGTNAGGEKADG